MVGSQLVQIGQQMRTNQQLNALHNHQLDQAAAQERLNWVKEQIVTVHQNFESAATLLETNPARAYYLCVINFLFLERESISTQSFHDLSDKQYFNQLWQYAQSIRDSAQAVLPMETAQEAGKAAVSQAILPQLRFLCDWTEIAELLPGGFLGMHYSGWQRPSTKWALTLFLGLGFFPLLIWPLFLWMTDPYPKVLPRIRELAQRGGGWVQNHVTHKEALKIALQQRASLEAVGLFLPTDSKALQKYVASAEDTLARFTERHLQIA
jgi:hypothetical protein